jgi:hypothetical protein
MDRERSIAAQACVKAACELYQGTQAPGNALEAAMTFFEWVESVSAGGGGPAQTITIPPPATQSTQQAVNNGKKFCPNCTNEMYDNVAKKQAGLMKPNAPDYKCKSCGWAIGGFAGAGRVIG